MAKKKKRIGIELSAAGYDMIKLLDDFITFVDSKNLLFGGGISNPNNRLRGVVYKDKGSKSLGEKDLSSIEKFFANHIDFHFFDYCELVDVDE